MIKTPPKASPDPSEIELFFGLTLGKTTAGEPKLTINKQIYGQKNVEIVLKKLVTTPDKVLWRLKEVDVLQLRIRMKELGFLEGDNTPNKTNPIEGVGSQVPKLET